MRRLYFESLRADGGVFPAPRSAVHYLRDVLRAAPGDRFVVFDGTGTDHTAVVESAGRGGVFLRVVESAAASGAESPVRLCLCQSLLRGPRMDEAVAAAAQIGAAAIEPVLSERCVARPEDARRRAGRWAAVAREAAKVSRRPLVPAVGPVRPFLESVGVPAPRRVLFWEGSSAPLRSALGGAGAAPRTVRVFVGPEGGYTDGEVAAAEAAGVRIASLGPRILRAETAAAAAVLLVMYELEAAGEGGE